MRKMPSISDYFVVASGTSTTQVRAITDNIRKKLGARKQRLWHSEGEREALWVVLDYGAAVAHVFNDETRRFYDLERLWRDVPQRRFKEAKKREKTLRRPRRASSRKR